MKNIIEKNNLLNNNKMSFSKHDRSVILLSRDLSFLRVSSNFIFSLSYAILGCFCFFLLLGFRIVGPANRPIDIFDI